MKKAYPRTAFAVREFKPFERNTLRGFLTTELPSGLVLHGFTLHQKGESRWLGMPSKEVSMGDGTKSWVPQVEFSGKEAREKLQTAALAAVDAHLATGGTTCDVP